ncbi:MAG TPA: class E sortase [Candidatus Saccharibacteria bacterium]|nr:class E sortase [Candidatus Saccharibacteria bacterium]
MNSKKNIHYSSIEGVIKTRNKKRFTKLSLNFISISLFFAGVYLMTLVFAPALQSGIILGQPAKVAQSEPKPGDNILYIPKIGLEVPFLTGDESVMEQGAWHRYPERGDPETGGNFILSAHRFIMKWTPGATMDSSPFYNVGKLNVGDQFIVDYKGKRYNYEITKKYGVKPTDIAIEDPVKDKIKDAKLTLYSCTLKGSDDGREVFEAKLKN